MPWLARPAATRRTAHPRHSAPREDERCARTTRKAPDGHAHEAAVPQRPGARRRTMRPRPATREKRAAAAPEQAHTPGTHTLGTGLALRPSQRGATTETRAAASARRPTQRTGSRRRSPLPSGPSQGAMYAKPAHGDAWQRMRTRPVLAVSSVLQHAMPATHAAARALPRNYQQHGQGADA